MPAKAPIKKNNKKKAPKIVFKSNNVEPSLAKEYEAAWALEYEKLAPHEKAVIDKHKGDEDDSYKRDWLVDAFVARVIGLVENPPVTEKKD